MKWFEDTRDKIVRAELKVVSDVEGFINWRRTVLAARQAVEALAPFEKKISAMQLDVDSAFANFANAERLLGEHLARPVPNLDYAAPALIKNWETRRAELEAAVQERGTKLRAAKETLQELRFEATKKQHEVFDRPGGLLFQAEQLQPREPEKPTSVGTLSAVN